MVRVHVGGVPVELDPAPLAAALDREMPGWVRSGAGLAPQEQAVRLAVKAAVRGMLTLIDARMTRAASAAGAAPFAPPRPPRGVDVIEYAVSWLTGAALAMLERTGDFTATVEELPDGAIRITRLTPTAAAAGLDATAPGGVVAQPVERGE